MQIASLSDLQSSPHLVLTVTETCNLLQLPRMKVYFMLNTGIIEGSKIGSEWRIKRSSVEKFLPNHLENKLDIANTFAGLTQAEAVSS